MSRGAGRGNVTVDNFPTTQVVSGTVGISEDNKALIVYEDGDVMYVCKAAIGSALSSAVWQISKVDTTSGVVIQWCDSNANFDNTATDLATVQGHTYG
jgi:hypothetical protein